ncbi:hypothetical protein BJV74DRAFT_987099 [Russula compacta]|nr:hypothetical protein BJV74DRAFT_987099 [Russula compacta]
MPIINTLKFSETIREAGTRKNIKEGDAMDDTVREGPNSRTGAIAASNARVSFSQFNDLIEAALREYSQKTGKDIPTHPLTARILRCDSSDAVLAVLQEHAHAFSQYRNGDWKTQLMRRLKPTVEILIGLSNSGVFGQVVGLKFPPAQAIFAGVGLLLAAAKGVSTSYDALIDLFECFEHYLGRLKIFTEIPTAVGEILVKIMVELLGVLALATQQVKLGRFKVGPTHYGGIADDCSADYGSRPRSSQQYEDSYEWYTIPD